MTRQIDRTLTPPAAHQQVEGIDMCGDQRARRAPSLDREQTQDARADGPRHRQEHGRLGRSLPDLVTCPGCEVIEGIGVVAQQISRTGKRSNGSWPELGFQQGQQGACPNPPVCRIDVVRVHPRREAGSFTGGRGRGPGHTEKWTDVRPATGRHTGEGPRPRTAGQSEQDLLSLVVAGVTEHDHRRAQPCGDLFKCRVSRVPRLSLGAAAIGRYLDPHDLDGIQAKASALLCTVVGHRRRALLQAMVDDDGPGSQAGARRLEGDGCRERKGVRTAAAGDEHESTWPDPRELSAHGNPRGSDGGMRSGHLWSPIIRGFA